MALARLFVIGISIALPIILEARYNSDRYLFGWLNHRPLNNEHSKDPEIINSESYYDPYNMKNTKVMSYYRGADENRKRGKLESDFIFPDESSLLMRNNDDDEDSFVPTCTEKNFCLNDSYYPTNLINQMLSNDPGLMNYATSDAVETISHRIDLGEDQLCESSVHLINPRSAKNIENDWLFIIQSKESNFTQSIRIELCHTENTACQKIEGFALGYKTMCRQKFIYRQLAAISHQGKIVHDLFPIPASCCCHIIKDEISS